MPFGRKTDAGGRVTNFDSVYQNLIAPAVEKAGLEPIRPREARGEGAAWISELEKALLDKSARLAPSP
jgi:hypothetical protein